MQKELKGIAINALYMYMVQGLNILLPILVLPYLLKTLSVESFGVYSFVFAFSQFVILFVDFGFNISATKKIAENCENHNLVRETFWNIIFIKWMLSIISLLPVGILMAFVPKIGVYTEGIFYSYIMVFGNVFFPLWWFQGMNKMKPLGMISAVSKILTYPLIFVFVKENTDYLSAIVIQSISLCLSGVLAFFYIYNNDKAYFSNIKIARKVSVYKEEIKEAVPIFLSNSTISLYTNSLTLMLGVFSTNYNVGLFGAMEKIVRVICFGIFSPINQVCFPVIAQMKRDNLQKAKKIFYLILGITFGVLSLSYITFLLAEDYIITHFLEGYKGIDTMLKIFMLMIFPIALGGIFGQLGLLGLGGEREKKIFSRIYIYIGLLSVPFSLFCIKYYELWGTIWAMMVVEVLIFLMMFFYFLCISLRGEYNLIKEK
ncbi:hypothetical protein BPO_0853 [Bergeyella porcorum]|uniref:Flippase n=1 Tax=Bergeyella porcorum TaxID=1735111 RepID=A0AAU0EZQ7_9FLAO